MSKYLSPTCDNAFFSPYSRFSPSLHCFLYLFCLLWFLSLSLLIEKALCRWQQWRQRWHLVAIRPENAENIAIFGRSSDQGSQALRAFFSSDKSRFLSAIGFLFLRRERHDNFTLVSWFRHRQSLSEAVVGDGDGWKEITEKQVEGEEREIGRGSGGEESGKLMKFD